MAAWSERPRPTPQRNTAVKTPVPSAEATRRLEDALAELRAAETTLKSILARRARGE